MNWKRVSRLTDAMLLVFVGAHFQGVWSHTREVAFGLALSMTIALICKHVKDIRGLKRGNCEMQTAIDNAKKDVEPQKAFRVTARQMLLVGQIADDDNPHRAQAMLELWQSIYGQEPDLTRPFDELVEEVSVAFKSL